MAENPNAPAMSAEDEKLIADLKEQWEEASGNEDQAAMDNAHKAAEAIRAKYGYGGGADGSQYVPLSNYYDTYGAAMNPAQGTQVSYYAPGATSLSTGYVYDGHTYDANGNLLGVGSIVLNPDKTYQTGGDYVVTYEGGMLYQDYIDRVKANTITPVTGGGPNGVPQGTADPGFDWARANQTGFLAAGNPDWGQNNNYYLTTDANGQQVFKYIDPAVYAQINAQYGGGAPAGTSYGTGAPAASNATGAGVLPASYGGSVDGTAESYINGIYAAQTEAATAALKAAYEQNVLAGQAARNAIPDTYNEARNNTAGTAAVNRQSFNEYAASSGLNSGTGGQARLAMDNALMTNLSGLDKQQAKDISAVDLQLAQLKAKYEGDIATAIANGQLQKAQTLYQQWQIDQQNAIEQTRFEAEMALRREESAQQQSNTEYNRNLYYAEFLAKSGDFSGYKALNFTPEQLASLQVDYVVSNATGVFDSKRIAVFKKAQTLKNKGLTNDQIFQQLQEDILSGDISQEDVSLLISMLI